jgi:hypothetical protein
VRVNAGAFVRAGLDAWFQDGMEQLRRERSQLPTGPTRFFLPMTGSRPIVGAFAPGQDALGRAFPVVISAVYEPLPGGLSLLPVQLAPFLDACSQLALDARDLTAIQLVAEVAGLSSRVHPAVPDAVLETILMKSKLSKLCPEGKLDIEAAAYGLATALAACAQERESAEPSGRGLTLDVEAANDEVRAFWLEFMGQNLDMERPSAFWKCDRMLLALGLAPSCMLAYLADANHRSSHHWPLSNQKPEANRRALASLSQTQAGVLRSGDPSLLEILCGFSRRGDGP